MSHVGERYRLLVLGSGRVGKTSIIRRYLHDTFSERYKETVEDIFPRQFHIHGALLPLDIYDTNYGYPDMRRVSIVSANAFMFVFAVDNVNSFKDATELVQEVVDRRVRELGTLPMILVGNKSDAPNKKIYPETVKVWLNCLSSKKSMPYLETSAKENSNIVSIFKCLLDQSGFPSRLSDSTSAGHRGQLPNSPGSRVRVQAASLSVSTDPGCPDDNQDHQAGSDSPKSPVALNRVTRTLSRREKPVSAAGALGVNGGLTRHGSLMRKTHRLSLKIRHANADEPDESDCKIS